MGQTRFRRGIWLFWCCLMGPRAVVLQHSRCGWTSGRVYGQSISTASSSLPEEPASGRGCALPVGVRGAASLCPRDGPCPCSLRRGGRERDSYRRRIEGIFWSSASSRAPEARDGVGIEGSFGEDARGLPEPVVVCMLGGWGFSAGGAGCDVEAGRDRGVDASSRSPSPVESFYDVCRFRLCRRPGGRRKEFRRMSCGPRRAWRADTSTWWLSSPRRTLRFRLWRASIRCGG